nr:hypothetical protein [Tolivirales sp.]
MFSITCERLVSRVAVRAGKGMVSLSEKLLANPQQSNALFAAAASLSVGAGLIAYHYQSSFVSAEGSHLREILEGEIDGAPSIDLTEEVSVATNSGAINVAAHRAIPVDELSFFADETTTAVDSFPAVELREKVKRRVKAHCRKPYQREMVAAAKAKFGVAKRTEANSRAIRRFCIQKMASDHMRDTHMQALLPVIVEAVMCPDKYEIKAGRMACSGFAVRRQVEYQILRAASGYTQA